MPSQSYFLKLYIQHLHNIDHSGLESTLAKLQSKFWVLDAKKLIRYVKNKCVICKRLDALTVDQEMGQVAPERLHPAPPFCHTSLDLFGSLTIRDAVNVEPLLKHTVSYSTALCHEQYMWIWQKVMTRKAS